MSLTKSVEKDYNARLNSYLKSRSNLSTKLCFSIDSKGARAIDDAISIEKVDGPENKWMIGIHIADVAEFVVKDKEIDRVAKKNVESKYVGKYFFKQMLPRKIYEDLASLKAEEKAKKLALSLYFEINDEGMIYYKAEQKAETIKYEESILKNHA